MTERDIGYPTGSILLAGGSIRLAPRMSFLLGGELDLSSAPAFTAKLSRAFYTVIRARGRPASLRLDLQDLTFIDSAGIHALVAAKRRCDELGTSFSLEIGDTQIRRLLTVAGFADFFVSRYEGVPPI